MMRFLFVARAASYKGLVDLLSALKEVEQYSWSLTVVGDIPTENRGSVTKAQNHYRERLHVLGARPLADVPTIMRNHDVLIIPSRHENFCNVALEGLACGLPIIGARLGGVRDLVQHGKTGLLFEPRNVEGLVEQLTACLEDPQRVLCMKGAAADVAIPYAWQSIGAMTDELLRATVAMSMRGNP